MVTAGAIEIEVIPHGDATRPAMSSLLGCVVGEEKHGFPTRIVLNDLRGKIRLLVPTGEFQFGFQRAKGALSMRGSSFGDPTGWTRVEITEGKTTELQLSEPEPLPDATMATERRRE
ncbi:MAG: hypothetical protein ACI89X_004401 [Planctomycetota bacterium]